MAIGVQASGILRGHKACLKGAKYQPNPGRRVPPFEPGRPTASPGDRTDHLRLTWAVGVGAAIVVRGRENLLQGEGPQSSVKPGG